MSLLGADTVEPESRLLNRALFGTQLVLLALVIVVVAAGLLGERRWPASAAEWILTLAPVGALLLTVLVFVLGSARGRAQRGKLLAASATLRASVRRGAAGDEALRVSTERRKFGARRLRDLVERGRVSDANLSDALAKGLESDENLRVAVASGLVGDDNLRAAVASGVVTDEKLRLSVAAGLLGAEALRVSVADGVLGAEALRVSIEQGIDAASTTLAVVDTVDAAITLYAPDGHILLTNDTARTLAVLARSEELDPLEFADDRITPIPLFDQVLARAARGQLVTRRAYWVGTGDAQRAIMSTSQYVRRASGELIGTVVASHDVTPLARTRDEFLETVSHELRTPLTSMIGYLEIIEDALDLEETGIAREFEVIQRNTDRLLKLINDLLLTSKGEAPSDRRPVDVTGLAVSCLNSIRQRAESVGVRLLTTDAASIVAEVEADRIGDAFDKVFSNALKFNRPDGQIQLAVLSDETHVIVRISDTGMGMTADDRQRMFERFYRAPSSRIDVIAGAGLGLTTAKIIVDAHHGAISAVSALGEGTTVEIRLPLLAAPIRVTPLD
ncbi:sensor histidine kinase [Cryobacterium arcticum]|nr:ATP-binding protein [Cryobacterium arcticum]